MIARITLCAVGLTLLPFTSPAADKQENWLHHTDPRSCKQCHEEIYHQWNGSMHANSSALKDPLHGAFYRNVIGDPTAEGVRTKQGKFPVCLKCHAPVAAMEKKTKLDAEDAYANGISCVTCHSFKSFKGTDNPKTGKPLYGIDAYEIDKASLHGPTGATYTTDRVDENASWPTPIHHPVPLTGNNSRLFKSNDACMGCHEKRANAHGTPLCRTGNEYRDGNNFVSCQACHMAIVTVPKMKEGKVVEGEFVSIADHSMAGGHDAKMVARGLFMDMQTSRQDELINARIILRNRLPHSYPTGAPFRNFYLKIALYDAAGKELWKNYKVHPIKDDPKAAFWYTLGNDAGKPTSPPMATQVLGDSRLKPNEERILEYDIPLVKGASILRAEALYDLLLPPIKAKVKGKVPDDLLRPKLAASAEIRL